MRWRARQLYLSASELALLLVLPLACAEKPPVSPVRPEPFVYLVLNQRSLRPQPPYEQMALLLTTGSPTFAEYRNAEQFTMLREADGAAFAWTNLGQTGRAPIQALDISLIHGNWGLSTSPSSGLLGANDLVAGETYTLHLETGGATITGRTTIPPPFSVTIGVQNGERTASWPRVVSGGLFSVEIRGMQVAVIQADTVAVIPSDPPMGAELRVRAFDANLTSYVENRQAVSAGIQGGFGVFGAITTVIVPLNP